MTTEAIHITTPVDVDTAFSWDELYSRYAPVMYGYILKRLKNKAAADEVFSTAF
ncbi:MAG: sigma-70 family RNA polymerase sigma factor, partial [Pedobacter sp.]